MSVKVDSKGGYIFGQFWSLLGSIGSPGPGGGLGPELLQQPRGLRGFDRGRSWSPRSTLFAELALFVGELGVVHWDVPPGLAQVGVVGEELLVAALEQIALWIVQGRIRRLIRFSIPVKYIRYTAYELFDQNLKGLLLA